MKHTDSENLVLTGTQLRHHEEEREQQLDRFLHGSVIQTGSKLHLQCLVKTRSSQIHSHPLPRAFGHWQREAVFRGLSVPPVWGVCRLAHTCHFLHAEHLAERVRFLARGVDTRASSVHSVLHKNAKSRKVRGSADFNIIQKSPPNLIKYIIAIISRFLHFPVTTV